MCAVDTVTRTGSGVAGPFNGSCLVDGSCVSTYVINLASVNSTKSDISQELSQCGTTPILLFLGLSILWLSVMSTVMKCTG